MRTRNTENTRPLQFGLPSHNDPIWRLGLDTVRMVFDYLNDTREKSYATK